MLWTEDSRQLFPTRILCWLHIHTTIDPRFKTKFCKDDGRSTLVNELQLFQGSSESDLVASNPKEKVSVISRGDGPHEDLWSCFQEIVADNRDSDNNVLNLEEEVNAFLGLPLHYNRVHIPGGFRIKRRTRIFSTSR